jgi:putative ABC transport system ATP-binding protein
MSLIEVREVVKEYRVGKVAFQALRGLSLEAREGEFLCIMGPSGSGKTTLLNLVGLLDTPSAGEIFLEGKATRSLSYGRAAELRRHFLGFIFQSFNLFPVLNAFENVEYPLLFLPLTKEERRKRVWQALSDVQLREVALQRPDEMSGGQQQRVAIARAIVTHPRVILADEPTAHLDSESAETVISVMQELNRKLKATFLFSTHDPRIMHHATRVVRIKDGVIQGESAPAAVTNILAKRLPK